MIEKYYDSYWSCIVTNLNYINYMLLWRCEILYYLISQHKLIME